VRLVAKVNASFKQLTHRKIGKRHSLILRLVPPETCEQTSLLGPAATGRPFEPCFRVRWPLYSGIFARSKEIGPVLAPAGERGQPPAWGRGLNPAFTPSSALRSARDAVPSDENRCHCATVTCGSQCTKFRSIGRWPCGSRCHAGARHGNYERLPPQWPRRPSARFRNGATKLRPVEPPVRFEASPHRRGATASARPPRLKPP
jgi:hypothetical protein